jgi:hypothetical protein
MSERHRVGHGVEPDTKSNMGEDNPTEHPKAKVMAQRDVRREVSEVRFT